MLKCLKISIEHVFEFVNLIIFFESSLMERWFINPPDKTNSKIFLLFNSNFLM